MKRILLATGVIALVALPASALAHGEERPPEAEKPPESVSGSGPGKADAALYARGAGRFVYRGSGGIEVRGAGAVTIRSAADAISTPQAEGFEARRTSDDGTRARYVGAGSLSVDCSACKVVVRGRFRATVNPTDTNLAIGVARARGHGYAQLAGGPKASFRRSKRIVLTRGPLDVDLFGRGVRREGSFSLNERGRHGDGERPVETPAGEVSGSTTPTTPAPEAGSDRTRGREGRDRARGRDVRGGEGRRHGRRNARWRLGGPANGSATFDEITGRLKVKDLSDGKDLVVVVPDRTRVETRDDGTTIYSGLENATGVTVTGTAFRMLAKGAEVDGAFLPKDGTIARSVVYGRGRFSTPNGEGRSHRRKATSILLQGAAPPPPPGSPVETPAS